MVLFPTLLATKHRNKQQKTPKKKNKTLISNFITQHQPNYEWFLFFIFFIFLCSSCIKSRFGFGADPKAPFLPPWNQQCCFTPPTPTPKQHNLPPQPLIKWHHLDHEMTPWPPCLIVILINRVSMACGCEGRAWSLRSAMGLWVDRRECFVLFGHGCLGFVGLVFNFSYYFL